MIYGCSETLMEDWFTQKFYTLVQKYIVDKFTEWEIVTLSQKDCNMDPSWLIGGGFYRDEIKYLHP